MSIVSPDNKLNSTFHSLVEFMEAHYILTFWFWAWLLNNFLVFDILWSHKYTYVQRGGINKINMITRNLEWQQENTVKAHREADKTEVWPLTGV